MNCFNQGTASNECLESILQTLAEGLCIVDTQGIIQFVNNSLEELTGRDATELIGQKCCFLMADKCEPPPTCKVFSIGSISSTECYLLHKSGKKIPVLKNARVLYDKSGKPLGAVETLTDLSLLKNTESKLNELEKVIRQQDGFGQLVGKSQVIREVFNLIELSAASNATVLITGETGTGKELVAKAIHENSSRSSGPLVKINCSALPETLLESELFGHVRGSFTGAIKDKPGKFELADSGTLFLDEIGELSPLIQVKLLRFLQEREFERVGESIVRKADVRIITATHRDLRKLVSEGKFREDLYYRLKVFPIHLPSLRERKEDIGLLIDHFIHKFNNETKKQIKGLDHDAAITMMDYCWPGNIRELENAIEHAFVTCKEGLIGIFDLPLEIRRVELRKGICLTDTPSDSFAGANNYQNTIYFHKSTISDEQFKTIYEETNKNQSETARRLGVDRTTVWRRLKKLKLL